MNLVNELLEFVKDRLAKRWKLHHLPGPGAVTVLNDDTVAGLARQTDNRRFALDAYRRFISMFGNIVMNVPNEKFNRVLERYKAQTDGGKDTDLTEAQLGELISTYKRIIFSDRHGDEFPQDPYEQLRMAIAAVFDSWNRRRAIEYRRVHHIPDDLGTAVNVQTMVFGNMGSDSHAAAYPGAGRHSARCLPAAGRHHAAARETLPGYAGY